MAGDQDDGADKSHEPTAHKLEQARKKGEIPRSTDLLTASSYLGFLVAALAVGPDMMRGFAEAMLPLIEQPDRLADAYFGNASRFSGDLIVATTAAIAPWLVVPAALVLVALFAQRALLFTPSKLVFKLSRISPIENAKNKYGRRGLFEFAKSFVKLSIYSVCLATFLTYELDRIAAAATRSPNEAVALLGALCLRFLGLVVVIAAAIGIVDALWQRQEHNRQNRMSQKELRDEHKESEGDPYMKQHRRARAQEIASQQMMAAVPDADVVIVNPTHYAVALTWSRRPGEAPICVAKGVDEIAARIRERAADAGVPIHSDPPTARALHATTEIGAQISADHYKPVAAAIRFAQDMRRRAKEKGW